jgi:hypothetical protein
VNTESINRATKAIYILTFACLIVFLYRFTLVKDPLPDYDKNAPPTKLIEYLHAYSFPSREERYKLGTVDPFDKNCPSITVAYVDDNSGWVQFDIPECFGRPAPGKVWVNLRDVMFTQETWAKIPMIGRDAVNMAANSPVDGAEPADQPADEPAAVAPPVEPGDGGLLSNLSGFLRSSSTITETEGGN